MASGDSARKVEMMEVSEEVQYPVEKVWQACGRLDSMLAAIMADVMPSRFDGVIHYEKGDPLTPGSVFVAAYHQDMPPYNYLKFRWDEMDDAQHRWKCTVIDRGALKHFSHLAYNFSVTPGTTPSSCVMRCAIEFVAIGEHSFHDLLLQTFCTSLKNNLDYFYD